MGDSEIGHTEDVKEHIKRNGLTGIEEFLKGQLEEWKKVEIKIGVTGVSGVGKSSFINAIRGLEDYAQGAALTDVTERTRKPEAFLHSTNEKIQFWDLPGIGTPNSPDLDVYCAQVELETYDTFLIFTAGRFMDNDLQLAKKLDSIKKSYFFVRAKIDQDVANERRKKHTEEETLKKIREDLKKNLSGLAAGGDIAFLISNHHPAKWDFPRLTQAILDILPQRQKESLTLSLDLLVTSSKDLVKRKVEVLRGRLWRVAATSGIGAIVPVPGLSAAIDLTLITKEVRFYNSQLGLPDQNSEEFRKLTPEMVGQISKFFVTSALQVGSLLAAYAAASTVEEYSRFIPLVGSVIAGSISFTSTYYFLNKWLNELEETTLKYLDEINARVTDDMGLD